MDEPKQSSTRHPPRDSSPLEHQLEVEVEAVESDDVEAVDEEKDVESLIIKIKTLKDDGNELYAKGKMFVGHTLGKNTMVESCGKYAEALQLLTSAENDLELAPQLPSFPEFDKLRSSIFLNIAQTSLLMKEYPPVINCCTAVLTKHPDNTKALYRRSKAYTAMGELAKAEVDLKAVALLEKKKQYYVELEQLRKSIAAEAQKQAFLEETEKGLQKMLGKCEVEDVDGTSDTDEITKEWLGKNDVYQYIRNGHIEKSYAWGQSLTEVHLIHRIPNKTTAKQIQLQFHRKSLNLKVAGNTIIDRQLSHAVTVHECTWELETPSCLHIVLFKEPIAGEKQPGQEWWSCVFPGDTEIDTMKQCSVGDNIADLPVEQKRELEKSLWLEEQKTPEQKEQEKQIRQANVQFAKERQQREANNKAAMKDPAKKALAEMMKDKFPNIPVEFK